MDEKELLTDEELDGVSGGVKSGEFNSDGKVYIKFPLIVNSFSGYYNTAELESLATQYAPYASMIASGVTPEMRNAITSLYEKENKTMPDNVKTLLGL